MKTIDLNKLVRANVQKMKPYSSARDEFEGEASIFLDANENPFSRPYNRYPDPSQKKLKEKIASLKKLNADQIFLGNGSDEAIDVLLRAFCTPGKDNVIIPQPTYGMYAVSAETNDVAITQVPFTTDFHIDVDRIRAAINPGTKIIFLCSPNNPSGNLLRKEDIKTLLNEFSGLIVVDEAYIDFTSEPSLISWLSEYQNLVVLQTFSKAWGLAALRLGMCFADSSIIQILNKIKPPYNINGVTQQLALEHLQKINQTKIWTAQITTERGKLEKDLVKLKCVDKVFPSDANFILVKVEEAKKLYDYLLSKGIVVRDRSNVLHCDNCLRITVGTEEENKRLLLALNEYR